MRILLYPISLLYGLILALRNVLFDIGILSSVPTDRFSVGVGNIRVGGTGKSPMIEYLIRKFGSNANVGVVSRGYGRSTSDIIIASSGDDASIIGDEPAQFKSKFPTIRIAVGASRAQVTQKLISAYPDIKTILFDDVFQHRYVKPNISILLTAYDDLYSKDLVLPAGMLREFKSGANRADMVVVTKCPETLTQSKRSDIAIELGLPDSTPLCFARIKYGELTQVYGTNKEVNHDIVLVTGIDKPKRLADYIGEQFNIAKHFNFADHHTFTRNEISFIKQYLEDSNNTDIITSEKDWQRLSPFFNSEDASPVSIYVLPIEMEFLHDDDKKFNDFIDERVRAD